MIYETVILANPEASEGQLNSVNSIVTDLLKESGGELLLQDSWGMRKLAQSNAHGKTKGHYFYSLYKADQKFNSEFERRLKINENVMNSVVVKLGEDKFQEKFVKAYKSPFSNK